LSPFQFLHGIFSTDIVRKVKSSSQYTGNGPHRTFMQDAAKVRSAPTLTILCLATNVCCRTIAIYAQQSLGF
jgi:hypothetical protein